MTAWLTRLPEDPLFSWRIHADKRGDIHRNILLTDEELKSLVKSYYDWQDVDEPCPACGKDPMDNQAPYHWEHEPMDQFPKED